MNKREKEINKIKILIKKYHNKVPLNDIPINNFIDSHSWFDIKESEEFNFTNTLKIKNREFNRIYAFLFYLTLNSIKAKAQS